jgi:hypothetical protein
MTKYNVGVQYFPERKDRQHVFCEQIEPGMDRTEVRSKLSQYGDFSECNEAQR